MSYVDPYGREHPTVSEESYVRPARYAKKMMAVTCASNTSYKTRAARLADSIARSRYSGRENAYIMSQRAAERFQRLYAEGWDANAVSGALYPPEGSEK